LRGLPFASRKKTSVTLRGFLRVEFEYAVLLALFAYPVGLPAARIAWLTSRHQIGYVVCPAGVALKQMVGLGCSRYSAPVAWRVIG
jgi:hypothetical protein